MTGRIVDLKAVRGALSTLDALALAHPHLVGRAAGAADVAAWVRELEPILGAESEIMTVRTKGDARRHPVNIRMPVELLERLDWYAERLAALTGLEVSRSDALRHALGKALAQAAIEFPKLEAARAAEAHRSP